MELFSELPWYLPWHTGWPVYCGALVGLLGTAVVGGRRWRVRPMAWAATPVAVSASAAFAGLLWVRESHRPADRISVLEHLVDTWSPVTQFLSNEQFSMFATLWRLAWALPLVAVVSGAIATWAWLRQRRRAA